MVFVLCWNELRNDFERLFYGSKSGSRELSVGGSGIGGV